MADRCEVCDRLWAELATANNRLLALVERKYEFKELGGPHLEAQLNLAIDERQRLKQRILSHECNEHVPKQASGPAT